jgi:hypothetical protein
VLLGRRLAAGEAFRQALAYLHRMSPRDLGEAEYRRLWTARSDPLFRLLMGADQVTEAIALAQERLARWPDDPQVAFDVAAALASAAMGAGRGRPAVAVVLNGDCRQSTALALKTLWRGLCLRARAGPGERNPSDSARVVTTLP